MVLLLGAMIGTLSGLVYMAARQYLIVKGALFGVLLFLVLVLMRG